MSHNKDLTVEEIRLECSEGVTIAGQRWTKKATEGEPNNAGRLLSDGTPKPSRIRILCFHGFLDNCRTFHLLAPFLIFGLDNVELVALDFPGHGLSSHKSLDSPPMIVINETCYHMRDACRSLQWEDGFILIGHSLGSIIAVIYAASFPEQVQNLVLLDGYGPDNYEIFEMYVKGTLYMKGTGQKPGSSRPKGVVAERLQRHVQQRYDSNVRANVPNKRKRTYSSIHAAVQARVRTAELSPGRQWISMAAALELVRRAVVVDDKYPRVRFRHDPRFNLPPLQLNTMEQVDVYWSQIRSKTLWLRAIDGWPFPTAFTDRAEAILGDLGTVRYLPGSHHFHADPDTADQVGRAVLEFILMSLGRSS
ncbi:unnamed protein product [Cylindrotheca closterium]|uniref:AB hydrolase-1 domain-containing protein n=1 Tax=Cylindrotheca closterium TaxID=2856 RepID=A0AAD2FIU5_9STRA|nr:unnamed protein product [Cylindrotheca closterium]